jgi:hypothetical protein
VVTLGGCLGGGGGASGCSGDGGLASLLNSHSQIQLQLNRESLFFSKIPPGRKKNYIGIRFYTTRVLFRPSAQLLSCN